MLGPWGYARTRRLRLGPGRTQARTPRRARCRTCRRTHVLVPATSYPRRPDTVETFGEAVLAAVRGVGYRRAADEIGLPATTVWGWLQRARANSKTVRVNATIAAHALDPMLAPIQPKGTRSGPSTVAPREVRHLMAEVVFLHAGVADERSWPGPGLAYRRTGAVDPVEELFAALDAHDLVRPTLVGHSIGARTAIDAALEHPGRVEGLFLIAPSVSGAPVPESLPTEVRLLEEAIGEAEAVADLDEVNRLEAHLWLDGPMSSEGRVGGDGRALFLDMNGAALRAPEPMPERDREPAWPRLHELDIRTHVLVGELDVPHIIDRAYALADKIPGGTVELMSGVAHLPTLERPADVLASLERFLSP